MHKPFRSADFSAKNNKSRATTRFQKLEAIALLPSLGCDQDAIAILEGGA
ncbi:hypothetical protein [Lyngbya confervoides]|uniref:Transposase n=1 Tax=Lyngbya confervoides BDU141951 TaxID=1574623 RepID=A0ABD4T7N5_9CYAN|nr:hypothetical protein [Lyngbya confervoides]MCM1984473.1 hypothetical protein [Lyngbya confervoides BDU141951]